MEFKEEAFTFLCEGAELIGIINRPLNAGTRGVIVVVGGPQYRVGSHRQFLLLARDLASRGIPVMRFDYRGMGDSEGARRDFEEIGADIGAAVEEFFRRLPDLTDVVLWGLCDAASAVIFFAHGEPRVSGLVLLNPWVRTATGQARTLLKHYYLTRLLDYGFWRKLGRGEIRISASARSLLKMVVNGCTGRRNAGVGAGDCGSGRLDARQEPLPERMREHFEKFIGRTLFILSGDDLTAKEFCDVVAASGRWRRLLRSRNVTRHDLQHSNHTFSRSDWMDQVARWTGEWIASW